MKIGDNIQTIVEKGSNILHDLGDKRKKLADNVEDLFQDAANSFLSVFGNRGKLQDWWNGAANVLKNVVSPSTSESDSDDDDDNHNGLRPTKFARYDQRYIRLKMH